MLTYEEYKAGKDVFWSDIPHEKSQMVSKKKKPRYKWTELTRVKFKKVLNAKKHADERYRKRKCRNKNLTKKPWIKQSIDSGDFLKECNSTEHGATGGTTLPQAPTLFHIYAKSRTLYKIEFKERPSIYMLKNVVETRENIPAQLQLLTHQGKLLKPSRLKLLEPGDTIHVIVKGKGGGKDAEKSPKKGSSKKTAKVHTKDAGLFNLTTEKDVKNWLKDIVGIPESVYNLKNCMLHLLDVDTLESYSNPREVSEELNIPMGFSRKLVHLKDNPIENLICGFKKSLLETVTADDIASFAGDCLKTKNNVDKIMNSIRQEYIDGFVVMLYKDDFEELSKDLNAPKFIARKLLINVRKRIKGKLSEQNKQFSETSLENSVLQEQMQTQADIGTSVATDTFLTQHLGLKCVDTEGDENHECQLLAVYNSWENKNKLEEMFLFWVICKPDFTKQDLSKLWISIVRNMPTWLNTLPTAQKDDFRPGKKQNQFVYKGGSTYRLRENGAKSRIYEDVTPDEKESYKFHILILHENISPTTVYRLGNTNISIDFETKIDTWIIENKEFKKLEKTLQTQPRSTHGSYSQKHDNNSFDLSYYGDMKTKFGANKLLHQTKETLDNMDKTNISYAHTRKFKQDGSTHVYYKDYVIDRVECGSGMMSTSLEFKLFRTNLGSGNEISKFLSETLRFSCGCLNRRRNGTIYFGIADDQPVDGNEFKHGQIVGFQIMEFDISKSMYTEELQKAKCNWFDSPEANQAAFQCIKDPVFVKVSHSSTKQPLYVMEVDIEPSSHFCKGIKFKLNLQEGKRQGAYLYVRDGAKTDRIIGDAAEINFAMKLEDYDKQRISEETADLPRPLSTANDHKYMAEKLCSKLCKGGDRFDLSFWPILVSSKPVDDMKEQVYKTVSFISHIPWKSVFEFDNDSSLNGLCRHFFKMSETTQTAGEVFRDIENINELRNALRIPEKNIVIFCNGRSDSNIPRLDKYDWKKEYYPRIKGAINFFQQKSVVPVGRAIIICLLFSSDLEGFVEVFGEVVTLFGKEQVVLICADRHVFDIFKQSVLLQQIMQEKDLDNISIVGMPWEQTNECINKLRGVENPTVTSIPSSSGVIVEVEAIFEESSDCIEMLSAKQCEHRAFDTLKKQNEFSREKELNFYQGHRVEWWNFFFEGHVMERHCFQRLKEKVLDALSGRKLDKKRAVPIFLRHEPGAGGSTLARHILWHFRKHFRCAVITKLKEKTASDILSFWKYKESYLQDAQPVLLLIDSVQEQAVDPYELIRLITTQSWDSKHHLNSPVCVFLICMRDEATKMPQHYSELSVSESEFLSQKVEKKEKTWLAKKIVQLENTSKDLGLTKFKGEYFISFMIFHSNFNQQFLQRTVSDLLRGMDFESKSCKLLVYIALVISYVFPSKGCAAIAIPIECCSELMGQNPRKTITDTSKTPQMQKAFLWENELTGPERVLLIIEPKENGSGKQVRMAHPNLARTVIECAQMVFAGPEHEQNTKITLASISMDFLDCDILRTGSYAKVFVTRLCIELLTRRKKEEYDDDETTKFSPLIESILSQSKSWEVAAEVLKKGYELLKDGYVAQQLARLYLEHKAFDLAKKWAEEAIKLNPKRSSFLHTLGCVYKIQFLVLNIWNVKNRRISTGNSDVIAGLEIAFKALWLFHDAATCDKFDINLFACLDVISTVNCIARFIFELVDIDGGKTEIQRYFTDEEYFPDSVASWSKYHSDFKILYSTAEKAVSILDEHIYYCRCSYASKYGHDMKDEHRTSRRIKRCLPDMYTDFADFFGERTIEPPNYIQSDLLKDEWYRRSIVKIGGRRMVDLFKIVTKENALGNLHTVQKHLKSILDASSEDYLNMISVNVALAQLKASKQIGKDELLKKCIEIIHNGRNGPTLNMAHMYALMFQWPFTNPQKGKYNHTLLMKSIRHLDENFRTTKQQKPKVDNDLFKRENNVFNSVVLFYAAKGKGLSAFCHQSQLPNKRKQRELKDAYWERPAIQEKLRFINGRTRLRPNTGAVSVVVNLDEFGIDKEIEIRNLRCRRPEMTEIPVSFYLGFSLSGPVVCYIRAQETLYGHLDDTNNYDILSEKELMGLKKKIEELKGQKDLSEADNVLLRDEAHIDEALNELHESMFD